MNPSRVSLLSRNMLLTSVLRNFVLNSLTLVIWTPVHRSLPNPRYHEVHFYV
jgi:hypothetical protein